MTKDHNDKTSSKVVLITGSARRIGAAMACTLHAQGMQLALHYRKSRQDAQALQQKLNTVRPGSVILIQADLLCTHGLHELVKSTVKHFGQLDVLINNASTFYPTPVENVTEKDWDILTGSNMKAPLFLSQAASPYLKQSKGCILNIIDVHAERPLKNHTVYSMAKAGLAMMTKSLARELGPEIRVNGISPGAILWPENNLDQVTQQRIVSRTFLKRQGSPEDIAQTALFLIENAPYITGQIIAVDGGRSLNT